MRATRFALLYFALVFGAGVVLGVLRTLWLAPLTGPRAAELIELPLMALIVLLAARALVRRLRPSTGGALAAGAGAVLLVLLAEAVLVRAQGLTVLDYLAGRDAVAGAAYAAALILMALAPAVSARRDDRAPTA